MPRKVLVLRIGRALEKKKGMNYFVMSEVFDLFGHAFIVKFWRPRGESQREIRDFL